MFCSSHVMTCFENEFFPLDGMDDGATVDVPDFSAVFRYYHLHIPADTAWQWHDTTGHETGRVGIHRTLFISSPWRDRDRRVLNMVSLNLTPMYDVRQILNRAWRYLLV